MTVVYDTFADAVDEHYDPQFDGYDGIPPEERRTLAGMVPAPPALLLAAQGKLYPAPTIVVPYVAGINEGDVSDAVYAVKRAWARYKGGARLRMLQSKPPQVRRTWQPTFSQEFGAKSYTQVRHQKLAPFYDAYALQLLRNATAQTARDRIVAKQIAWHNAVYNRRMSVMYSQIRPSQIVAADRLTRADCSGSVAGGCAWAEILSKVDWRYTNTWSQVTFGHSVSSLADAIPGDVFFYGSPSHEALYLGDGLVWSFGSYPVKILRHDYRHDRSSIRRFVPLT